MKIIKIENKVTKTNKEYQLIELDVEGKVVKGSMWGIHDFKGGDIVDWQIVANGQYNNFYTKEIKTETRSITVDERMETLEKEMQKLKSLLSTGLAQIKSDVVLEITGKFLTTADYNKLSEFISVLVDNGEVKDGDIPF